MEAGRPLWAHWWAEDKLSSDRSERTLAEVRSMLGQIVGVASLPFVLRTI